MLKRSFFIACSLLISILVCTTVANTCHGQVTLLDEDFGTGSSFPDGWTASSTQWDNTNSVNSSGYTGASRGSNVQFLNTSTTARTLTYSNNLSTVGYTGISVLWGARYTGPATISITLSWSSNGFTWNNVSFTNVAKDATWDLVNNGTRIALPAGAAGISNLRLRLTASASASGSNTSYRVDDFTVQACGGISVSGTSTPTCVGGSTGTITASVSGGSFYTYSLNSGSYQSSNVFTGLGAGTYTLTARSNGGCTASTSVSVEAFDNSTDNQNAAGSDSWIGHIYDGTNFSDYIGQVTEAETFNELFSGSYTCFNVVSNGATRSIYTETFSAKFRMNSTKKGLYVVDLGADDASRLTVDGTLVHNVWSLNVFSTKPSVLISLKGSSALLYEYYENNGDNRIIFQNLTLVLANTLSANTTQTICAGSTGAAISGDVYGTLPSGITLSGTGYQWSYSTTPGGTRTNISGATGATFTPSASFAPFNTAGTYYVYRNAILSSANNVSPNPYVATNESNAAIITISALPTLSGAPTATCVGGSTGTITATAGGGAIPYTYSLNSGAYQASTLFTGLAAGTYTLSVKSNAGCVTSTSVSVIPFPASADNQDTSGTDSWVGHMYDGINFSPYLGKFTEAENFNELFGGSGTCFNITSNSVSRSIYTETFSVKFRMTSTKKGLYVVDLGADDGNRLTVDETLVYNYWTPNSFVTKPNVLISLTGASQLLYEYFEQGGSNQVMFQNLTPLLANTLSTNITQTLCPGGSALTISGDTYGTLPSGITLSGTGYQWSYSTAPGGARTAIAGATGATFTPSAAAPPFNVAGTYYIYREATLRSTNNISPNPYLATHVSNAATLTVIAAPSATINYANDPYCISAGTATVTQSGTPGGKYSAAAGLSIDTISGTVNLAASTPGTYTVSYTIATGGGCPSYNTTASITVAALPAVSQIPASNLIAYYRFEGNANDTTGNNNGTAQNNPAPTADRFNIAGKAYSFNGSSQYISTAKSYTNPNDFTISIWFKTTVAGGKLIGFGSAQTGPSGYYDRHLYMSNSGQIYFGVYPNVVRTVNTSLSYNDGKWHLATATLSGTAGMALYIDGVQVGSNASTVSGENYTGYWKIGYGNLNGWTNQPSNFYFNGSLDDALIYSRALTPAEVSVLYKSPDGAGNNGPVCIGSTLSLNATSVSNATYNWTGPNGFTSTSQNPDLVYNSSGTGVYTLTVIALGCTVTAYTNVAPSTNAGQWTGNTSTDWANAANWCNGTVPTSATNVVINAGAARMPVITSAVSCNNLTIHTGASVTISGTGNLRIAGNLVNNGTYTDNGTTTFNGPPGAQTFFGVSVFNNLTINNTDGLILDVSIVVKNTLSISTGTLRADNFNITIGGNWINNTSANAFISGAGTVIFNGTTTQTIGGLFNTAFNNVTIANSGASVILSRNQYIGGDLLISAGILDLGGFTADRTTPGGTLTVYNNTTLKIGGTNVFPANYSNVNLVVASNVEYYGTNQTISNQVYGNLILTSSSGVAVKTSPAAPLSISGNLTLAKGAGASVLLTAASAITVNGNVSIGASTIFDGGSYVHSIGGNWVNNGTFAGNASTVTFHGTGTAVSGAGAQNFNSITVAASGITFSADTIRLTGSLATTGSGAFIQLPGGVLVMTGAGVTISGANISLDDLNISGSVTTSASFTLTGNLSVTGSLFCAAGTITMSGSTKIISNAGDLDFSTLFISGICSTSSGFTVNQGLAVIGTFSATAGTVTFTGTSTLSGIANLYNVVINGTYLQLSASSVLGVGNLLSFTSGILDVTSSIPNTVSFNRAGDQNINGITYNNLILTNGNNKTATSAFTVNNNFTIDAGTTFIPGSYTHTVQGNWNNAGTFTAGTSNIQFSGTYTSNITGVTAFNTLTVNKNMAATLLLLQSNVSAAALNMVRGKMLTGANTVTITNSRSGNGIILGNIKRNHAFTTGVPYAFEGPNNTITFTSVSSVNSITVSVRQGTIDDFPFGGSISREYAISVPAGTYTAALRLHYENDELNGNSESTMTMWHYSGGIWNTAGKSANDTIANYIEQNGLADISSRWTLSDDGNVVLWNGSISSDWNTAGNWTVLQGSASRPPAETDIVDIGNADFLNQPVISTNVSVRNITLGNVKAVTLSLAPGGSLNTGDIAGEWNGNVTHTINVNNQPITINGNFDLSDDITGHAINLNIGNGSVTIAGSLTQSGGANINFSGAGSLNIFENFNYINGNFNAGSGTVSYNGIDDQLIGHVTYNNLLINKASDFAQVDSSLTIQGNLDIVSGGLDNSAVITVSGNVNIGAGTTFINTNVIRIGGNWLNNGTYIPIGSSSFFTGSGTQTISASNFHNLNIAKPSGTAIINGEISVTGDFNIMSGTFDFQTYFVTRDIIGGTASIANGATALITGNNGPVNFGTKLIGLSSTIIYDGSEIQYINTDGLTFGNVIFRNGGSNPKILVTPASIKGDLTIENGAVLDASSYTLTVAGNWLNNGSFIPSTSEVILAGNAKTVTGYTTFYRLTVTGSHSVYSDFVVDRMFRVTTTGTITSDNGIDVIVNGDLINRGVLITNGSGTFTGNVLQTINLINATTIVGTVNFNGTVSPVFNSTSVPPIFGFLNVNNTGGINPSVNWRINNALTVSPGCTFNGGPSTHLIYGNLINNGTITSSGSLDFLATQPVTINMGTSFSSTGTVVFGGSGAMTLLGTPAQFRDVRISNTNAAGITPSSNWNISNNFFVDSTAIFNALGYSFTVGGNFLNFGTINSGTSLFTLNGAGEEDIYSRSVLNNLTINKPSGISTLFYNLTIKGTLNFILGSITTDTNAVILQPGATLTGAAFNTGWVNGNLQKYVETGATTKTFEVGDSTRYTPTVIAFNNVHTPGDLTLRSIRGEHPDIQSSTINPTRSVNRHWRITNKGIGFDTYTATFNFLASDVDVGANTSAFKVGHNNGSSWDLPLTVSANATNIQARGINDFSDFAAGEICNAGTSISYADSIYCSNGGLVPVVFTGVTGGVYTSFPGLAVDSTTGSIDLGESEAGAYAVTYTLEASGGCPVFTTTDNVIISQAPLAEIAYASSPFCSNGEPAQVTQTGTAGGTYSSTPGLVINTASGLITPATSTPGTYTVTYTLPASGVCSQYQTTTSVSIVPPGRWSGAVSTKWHEGGNWLCGALPTSATDITLPTGLVNYPVLDSGIASVKTITIEAGAAITVTTGILQIAGSIINNGNFTASNGTIEFNGSAPQVIPATIFTGNKIKNLIISNNVTLQGEDSVTGVLSFGNVNNKTFTTGGYLTLRSIAAGTARVADITNGGINTGNAISGNVKVERFIPARRAWRLVTAPIASGSEQTINQAFQEGQTSGNSIPGYGTHITGGSVANGFDQSPINSSSLKQFNNATGIWDNMSATHLPVSDYPGYMIFVRGDRSVNLALRVFSPPTSTILRSTGQLKSGDQSFPVAATGFTVIGNPFASPINLNQIAKANSVNIQDNFYVWDAQKTGDNNVGSFVNISWDGSIYDITPAAGGSAISQHIQSGSAFFVRSANGVAPGTLVIKETDKSSGGSDKVYRMAKTAGVGKLSVNLYAMNPDGTKYLVDGLLSSFGTRYSNGVDSMDAVKIDNFSESFSIERNGQLLMVERRQPVTAADTVFYRMKQMKIKQYSLEFSATGFEDKGLTGFLEDSYLHTSTPVDLQGSTTFNFNVTEVPASWAPNRFRMVFGYATVLPVVFKNVDASEQNNAVKVEWQVENESAIREYDVERSVDGLSFIKAGAAPALASNNGMYDWSDANAGDGYNYYRIKGIGTNGAIYYSPVTKLYINSKRIVLHTNIIYNNTITFRLMNMPAGRYTVRLMNSIGQVFYKKRLTHIGGYGTETIALNGHLAKGLYLLEFTRPGNAGIIKKVFVE